MKDLVGINYVLITLKNIDFVRYYLIISIKYCKSASFTFQILEKIDGNRRTAVGALDVSVTSTRKRKTKKKRVIGKAVNSFPLWTQQLFS